MAGNLQPLDDKFAIVGPDGRPTLYFIQWCQQRQIDITDALTLLGLEEYLLAHKLREGPGIQITPSGNLTDEPIIAADAQEILDQISTTRGTVLYRGLLGWAGLAPGTVGDFLKTNGAGADPAWATPPAGSGSTGELTLVPPVAANFTYNGNASGSKNSVANGMTVLAPNNGTTYNAKAISNTNPASFANFTVTTKGKRFILGNQGGGGCGQIFLRNSSNGRMLILGDTANGSQVFWQRWQNDTTFNANITAVQTLQVGGAYHLWKRLQIVGSVVTPMISCDGINWDTGALANEPYPTYLTAAGGAVDQVGISTHTVNGSWNYTAFVHFALT